MAGLGLEVDRVRSHRVRHACRVLGRAALAVVERLEERQLLSMTPAEAQQVRYQWNHMGPYARQDLSALEYELPDFNSALDSDLASLGLTPVAPASSSDLSAPLDGKSRHARPHRGHHVALPKHAKSPHHRGPRKDDNPLEITASTQYIDTLPQQLVIGFNQPINEPQPTNWGHGEAELLNLKTGTTVPIDSASYDTYAQAVTYGFSTSAIPADGNYVALLHGYNIASTISTLADGSDVLVGPGVSNVDTPSSTYGFFQFDGDFNGDRSVNSLDLARMLANYNKPGNYAQGDANYDGTVNFPDLAILAARYNRSFPQLASPASLSVAFTSHDQVELTWPAVMGAVSYDVYRDGTRVANAIPTTTYIDGGLPYPSSNQYMVVARDAAGNTSYPAPNPLLLGSVSPETSLMITAPASPTANEGGVASLSASLTDSQGWSTHTASISWGDGTTSTGTISELGGYPSTAVVTGSHLYPKAGYYFGWVQVSSPQTTDWELFEAHIADLPLSATGVPSSRAVAGLDTAGTFGMFTDPDPSAAATLYTAHIAWGDGFTSAGTITQSSASFTVTGDHTYSYANSYAPVVTINDAGGAAATVTDSIYVDTEPPPLSVTGSAAANEGDTYVLTGSVANPDSSWNNYVWSIAWGDGTSDTITSPAGTFTHIYSQPSGVNPFTISAVAADFINGQTYFSAPQSQTVAVAEVAPTLSISGDSTITEGDTYVLGGSYVDPDGDLPDGWVVDWGDGSGPTTYTGSSDAVLDGTGDSIGGPADATHTYAKGTYTITASATGEGFTYPAGTQVVTVTDATPTFSVIGDSTFTKGQPYRITNGFTDFDSATSWSVAWGDGNTDTGTGDIAATLTHTYTTGTSSSYTIAANVTTVDGTYTNLSTVSETPATVSVTGGTSISAGVAYTLTGSYSDPNGNAATGWTVDWGDGSTPSTFAGSATSFTHRYATALTASGGYTIAAYATNTDGTYWAAPVQVAVSADAATASLAASNANPFPGQPITATASFTDANSVADAPYGWSIAFGDGTSGYANGAAATLAHAYSQPGTYTLVGTGNNQNGAFTDTATIDVVETTPTFSISGAASVSQGVAYSLSMSLSDPNVNDAAATYSVAWGDGQSSTGIGPVFTHTYLKPSVNTQHISATATIGPFALTATSSVSVTNVAATLALLNNTGNAESGVPTTLTASLTDPSSSGTSYSVSWGDGTSSPATSSTPSHSYTFNTATGATNSYTATMTALADGTSYTSTQAVQVYAIGGGTVTVSDNGPVIEESEHPDITLTAVFSDPTQDADLQSQIGWAVSWGDGSPTQVYQADALNPLTLSAAHHEYWEEGTYNVEVDAIYRQKDTDSYYCQAVTHDSAVVLPSTPSVFTVTPDQLFGERTVTALLNFYDNDDDQPVYTVYWGDGASSTGTDRAFTHTYAYSGTTKSYAITASGTTDDGTFQANSGVPTYVTVGGTTVSLTGGGVAYEHNQQPADIYVNRVGDTSQPLFAALSFGGTEDSGEYKAIDRSTGQVISGGITIPAGSSFSDIEIIPLEDNTPEWTDTILTTLQSSANYSVNPTYSTATISVANDDLGVTLGNGSGNIIMQGSSDGTHNLVPLVLNVPSNLAAGDEITLAVSQPGEVDVWATATPGSEDVPLLGTFDSQTTASVTYSSGDSVPETLWVGGIAGSAAAGDIKFTVSDSDLKASPAGFTTNSATSNAATCVMLHINLQEDPNDSGFLYKDVANQTLYWLPGQMVDLKAAVAGPANLDPGILYTDGWNVPGSVLFGYDDNDNGAKQTLLLPTNTAGGLIFSSVGTSHFEVRFFWTGTDSGAASELERVSFAINSPTLGILAASTTFDLIEPTSSFAATNQGATQAFGVYPNQLFALTGLPSQPADASGIELTGSVEMPVGVSGAQGAWKMVQLLSGYRTMTVRQPAGGTTVLHIYSGTTSINGRTVLDGSDPYPFYSGSSAFAPQIFSTDTTPRTMVDNPANGVNSTVQELDINEPFSDYLMFLPPGGDSRWVPLESLGWEWTLTAIDLGGVFTQEKSGPSPTPGVPWASEPTWTIKAQYHGLSYR